MHPHLRLPVCVPFLLAISAWLPSSYAIAADQIHLALTKQELHDVFAVHSHDQVPEYRLTRIRSRSRRHTDGTLKKEVSLSAFGKKHNLQLVRNEHLGAGNFRVFFADRDQLGSTVYQRAHQVEAIDVGEPYQDQDSGAAVIIYRDTLTDSLLLDGTIGSDLVIKPVPHSIWPHVTSEHAHPPDDEFFLDEDDAPSKERRNYSDKLKHPTKPQSEMPDANNTQHVPFVAGALPEPRRHANHGLHFVIKRSVAHSHSDYDVMEMDSVPSMSSSNHSLPRGRRRRRRSAPGVIYPEVLLIIDYDGYLLHEQNSNKIKKYFTSFMNGVDLRYRALRNPEIKITIAGMIISRRSDATPYLEKNMVTSDSIDSAAALTDMGKYLFQERRLPTYDIAMAITKHDLCRRRKSGKCTKGTAGFAYVGGACVVNKRLTKVNSVAIVEDTGGFSGIIVAAHELGHLLGNVHDGSPAPPYLGGPGARQCLWDEGFIMSDLRHTEKGFKWSPCSLEEFDHFLNGETASCLYNAPHERHRLQRHLPGQLLSLDAQCRRDRATSACFKDDRVCAQLFCFDQSTGYCVSYRPAAEGSPCGHRKYCRDGYCVTDVGSDSGLDSHYSYVADDFFTSATENKAVWSSPPQASVSSSLTESRDWSASEKVDHSGRQVRSTTERVAETVTTSAHHHDTLALSLYSDQLSSRFESKKSLDLTPNHGALAQSQPVLKSTDQTTDRKLAAPASRSRSPWRRRSSLRSSVALPSTSPTTSGVAKPAGEETVCEDSLQSGAGHRTCSQLMARFRKLHCNSRVLSRRCCATKRKLCNPDT